MERANQQHLKENKKSQKLEAECNQLKEEKNKLQHQSQQATEQYQKLCMKTEDLLEGQVFSQYFIKAYHAFPTTSSL